MNVNLQALLRDRNLPGHAKGIYSVCTANPMAMRAAMRQARVDDSPLLLEATSNQINQFGGYTRMRPVDYRDLVHQLAVEEYLPVERIILGGDHLGPNPWQNEPAQVAMAHAENLVTEYARAGFVKLHLDASMPCADDPSPLLPQTVALRSARLCVAAEKAASRMRPVYVIGTEVPTPAALRKASIRFSNNSIRNRRNIGRT